MSETLGLIRPEDLNFEAKNQKGPVNSSFIARAIGAFHLAVATLNQEDEFLNQQAQFRTAHDKLGEFWTQLFHVNNRLNSAFMAQTVRGLRAVAYPLADLWFFDQSLHQRQTGEPISYSAQSDLLAWITSQDLALIISANPPEFRRRAREDFSLPFYNPNDLVSEIFAREELRATQIPCLRYHSTDESRLGVAIAKAHWNKFPPHKI